MNKLRLLTVLVCLPLRHLSLTSPYGYRIHPMTGNYTFHAGVDFQARKDTIFSVVTGKISATGYDPALGLFIKINNGPFCITYGHLSQCFVSKGDSVPVAESLGVSGASGRVTGPHLHFAVQFRGRYIDPLAFLSAAYQKLNQ